MFGGTDMALFLEFVFTVLVASLLVWAWPVLCVGLMVLWEIIRGRQ